MAHWTDRNPPKPRPLAFGAGIFIIIGLALIAMAPFAGANNPPPTPNQVEFWCGVNGVKIENPATPFVIPDPPPGLVWTLAVLKAGDENSTPIVNEQFANPIVGALLSRTDGKDISHVILCYGVSTTTTTGATTTAPQCPEEPCVPDTQVITTTTIATTTTATTLATTTTAPTTTSCPDCTPGQQTVPTTVGTTTTQAPCLNCRSVETVPPPTPTTTGTTAATTTVPATAAPSRGALPPEPTDQFATTAPAQPDELPVTGGDPIWLVVFGLCVIALGGLAVLWVRS